ncbi:MAG: glutamate-5-semialdehyde dehydrogenase [Anaeromicrobium sp.]|jgi:glutamate-5-semialdehyde dehydrogenase|uniref:glutamate-5-semialdehyde dehydrogenase n=1 Tax=Anaeromicrobium sp. TaxID=1929132 RepID=UPI0025DC78A9|nr:glutamate-5-semialdehyde dehydrogenase [Anaeromicrobium sp.]MCT4593394.1 glutamate-5-semialdehyde dehydrogenase [Anaeromicrobium sp.]
MDMKNYVLNIGKRAKKASRGMINLDTITKNKALIRMAQALLDNKEYILNENKKDMKNGEDNGFTKALLDRLLLTEDRLKAMAGGLKQVASLDDPIGEMVSMIKRPNNLRIGKMRVPLGVVGIIYEARPNVTVDAAGLCIKSGNVAILRGGKEAINSNIALIKVISKAAMEAGLPEGCINLIEITDREAANEMMRLNGYIDVLIPRGGAGLIQAVVKNASVPVIETGVGNCHIYVDEWAHKERAIDIIINAKTQRPAVCNALETLLVHEKIAQEFLPKLHDKLDKLNVEIRGCEKANNILENIVLANEKDWSTEYLDLILAIKVVNNMDEALEHIHVYGTNHSESILTRDYNNSQRFLQEVDAAAVYVNASTRFTDGEEFGFGAEIGISTQKLHARGPMGLKELTTFKYTIYGEGQIR